MVGRNCSALVLVLVVSQAWAALGNPLGVGADNHLPLSSISERVASRVPRLQEQRLPIPSPLELEQIKKVAQVLIMLGEQIIPNIIGDSSSNFAPADNIPNDPVFEN